MHVTFRAHIKNLPTFCSPFAASNGRKNSASAPATALGGDEHFRHEEHARFKTVAPLLASRQQCFVKQDRSDRSPPQVLVASMFLIVDLADDGLIVRWRVMFLRGPLLRSILILYDRKHRKKMFSSRESARRPVLMANTNLSSEPAACKLFGIRRDSCGAHCSIRTGPKRVLAKAFRATIGETAPHPIPSPLQK